MDEKNKKKHLGNHQPSDDGRELTCEKIKKINHFYYCMNVAVKMKQRAFPGMSDSQRKSFYREWLNRAQEKRVFDKIVLAEITWLKSEIRKRTALDFEIILYFVYSRSAKF